jgi:hypothetical protein
MLLLITPCWVASCSHDTPTGADRTTDSPLQPQLDALHAAEWSERVKLGPPISVPLVTDGNATLSLDGLSLYYDSDRTDLPGARGARDIWASRRACTDALDPECAWQTPVNLGPQINTPYVDGLPTLSDDGHLLFFLSHKSRADCPAEPDEPDPTRPCDADIFVSWRSNPNDDLGWGPAVPLPAGVNTGDEDNVSAFVRVGEPGRGNLYFDRAGGTAAFDIFYVPIRVTVRGAGAGPTVAMLGPVVGLDEINLPNVFDGLVTLRADGRELFFTSTAAARPGGQGALDIWTSTRRSPHDNWSTPTNVAEVNSIRADLSTRLSHDGLTLMLTSNREMPAPPCIAAGLPGSCGWDIYMSARERWP